MDSLNEILAAFSAAVGATVSVGNFGRWLIGYLRDENRNRKAGEVLRWLGGLGAVSESDVRRLIDQWDPPVKVTRADREELTVLLSNLVRTSRFHSTHGTPLRSFLKCERLIERMLANIVPRRRAGESVGPGRRDWKLEEFLGMGAFGEVWVARNDHFPDRRAFKFFTTDEGAKWLTREAEALSRIRSKLNDHPNVIEYLDISAEAQPYPFLMLEYVAGRSLEDWILATPEERPALDVTETMAGIARGLAEAHRHRIYHRDLKPANVLLTDEADPTPKVADFGMSRFERETTLAGSSATASQAALVVGTQMYLPPEAADPYEVRDPAQDDVFAFGVMWYQMLTRCIERPSYDFDVQLLAEGVDRRTIRLLTRCLAHESRRFANAIELRDALEDDAASADWSVPADCFDVAPLAREYLDCVGR